MPNSLPHEFYALFIQNRDRNICHAVMSGKGTILPLCGYKGDLVGAATQPATICPECDKLLPRFAVREYLSHFEVVETRTGKTHPMGDGVDTLFDKEDRPIYPGTEGFREKWEQMLNEDAGSTAEAYFPEELPPAPDFGKRKTTTAKTRKAVVKKLKPKIGE